MQNFRRLRVWERAHQFALEVRKVTQSFPRAGYGELKAQLVSAAESIVTNIVEGTGAVTRKEFARYLDIAIKSASEVEGQLQLALDYGIILPITWHALSDEAVQIRRMLIGLRRAVLDADRAART
jgi:four helix bundle protein